ncbi:uncharacterized protein LOC122622083 [Drosophila teissieri]|uniref:uncharacterized protein LOC122622083 n=1 Tax=Drosophila teissieri TaxID=7243 RepID=UPI001CBA3D47|nr:uncharacterized protein LOC122622083 [Drosophila teissieri]
MANGQPKTLVPTRKQELHTRRNKTLETKTLIYGIEFSYKSWDQNTESKFSSEWTTKLVFELKEVANALCSNKERTVIKMGYFFECTSGTDTKTEEDGDVSTQCKNLSTQKTQTL